MSVSTYHCLCTELAFATTRPIDELAKRQGDGAIICRLATPETLMPGACVLTSAVKTDAQPIIMKLEDGFEKRYPLTCSRCGLTLAYQLDLSQYEETKNDIGRRDDVAYILPGGLVSTADVEEAAGIDALKA